MGPLRRVRAVSLDVTGTILAHRHPIAETYAAAARWARLRDPPTAAEFKPAFKKASCQLPNAKSRSSALTNTQRRQRKACSDDISSYRAFLHDF